MNKHIDKVIELSSEIMKHPRHVSINDACLKKLAAQVPSPTGVHLWGVSDPIEKRADRDHVLLTILYELLASSVNYCYWYGSPNFRPNESGSTTMYKNLDAAFASILSTGYERACSEFAQAFQYQLNISRMPMLKERLYHVNDFVTAEQGQLWSLLHMVEEEVNIEEVMTEMFRLLPGFAEDMFLKRTFLFFMMINRRLGLYESAIDSIPVPADYQIPKILEWNHAISYSEDLMGDIEAYIPIPKYSLKEVEIRAATILACNSLAKHSGYNAERIDDFLWMQRKEVTKPFHLTVTTDY